MRILHVAETIQGGVATHLQTVATYQNFAHGTQNVRFIVPYDQRKHLPNVGDVQVLTFRRSGRNVLSLLALSIVFMRTMWAFKPTIVHAHSTFAGVIVRVLAVFTWPQPKVIYTPHGFAFMMDVAPWKKNLYARIERLLAWLTTGIICVSAREKKLAVKYGIPLGKLEVIPHGLPDKPILENTARPGEKIQVLFVGRFDAAKGLDVLLAAVEGLQNKIDLTLVGESVLGDKKVAIPPWVQAKGWVLHDELSALYAVADVVVMPSRWEAFGYVALEAMRAAKAVIATDTGAMRDLIVPHTTGDIIPVDDTLALRSSLLSFSRSQLQAMGVAARQRFESHFTAAAMYKKLSDVYTDAR